MTDTLIELLIIRHGETDWNAERRLQGHVDIPLNQAGLRQAQAVASALAAESIDAVICSDLQRAIQTAEAIANPHQLPVHIKSPWRERSFGGFEGELISTLEQRFPAEYAAWRSYEVDSLFPLNAKTRDSGESIRQFHTRIEAALRDLLHTNAGKKIALIAHGGVLECAYRIAQQLPLNAPRQVAMLNASINRFELSQHDGVMNFKLMQWGDVAHLDAALDEITS
jgi:2,3-bisphosphoglycerate-dependent phosphoglycerate mutase